MPKLDYSNSSVLSCGFREIKRIQQRAQWWTASTRPQEEGKNEMWRICDSIEIWYYAFNINSREKSGEWVHWRKRAYHSKLRWAHTFVPDTLLNTNINGIQSKWLWAKATKKTTECSNSWNKRTPKRHKEEDDGRDRETGKKWRRFSSSDGTIEDQNEKKINFIVKLRKLLCIFGQSFRLSSINCRYYWAQQRSSFLLSLFLLLSLSRFSPVLSACGSLLLYFGPSFIWFCWDRWLWFLSIRSLVRWSFHDWKAIVLAIPSLSTPFMKI